MSPCRDSIAKSSFKVPTSVPSGARTTWKSPVSGIAPPDLIRAIENEYETQLQAVHARLEEMVGREEESRRRERILQLLQENNSHCRLMAVLLIRSSSRRSLLNP